MIGGCHEASSVRCPVVADVGRFGLRAAGEGAAFYVVLNSLTRTCTVVDQTPRTDTPNITVASDTIYPTRAEAEDAIKTLKPCNQ